MSFDERLRLLALSLRKATDPGRSGVDAYDLWQAVEVEAAYDLDTDRPSLAPDRQPLHWPLAFPEVFLDAEKPGFDAIVGNPPFLGGKRISGPNGVAYRQLLVDVVAGGRKGNADLVAYFFLRAARVINETGFIGFFATNTIAQGDTREVGLDQALLELTLYRAWRSRPWPGSAVLEIAQAWLTKATWSGSRCLDDKPVSGITAQLEAATSVAGLPFRLLTNCDSAFIGSLVNGSGFILSNAEAAELIEADPRNEKVVRPYLIGQDLVTSPVQAPSRWIVNFEDWSLEEAQLYPLPLAVVQERVKPVRDMLPQYKRRVRDAWWQYEYTGRELYARIGELRRCLALSRVGKVVLPLFAEPHFTFSEQVVVFAYDDDFNFGVLTSCFHWWWTVKYASTLESRIRYTPTDVFETFVKPEYADPVRLAGRNLEEHRRSMMIQRDEGLTKLYNRVHAAADTSGDVKRLRQLHVMLDEATAEAYGWSDLKFGHGFHDTKLGVRFTVDREAQSEILDRLLELNHARHLREQASDAIEPRRSRRHRGSTPGQISLMGED